MAGEPFVLFYGQGIEGFWTRFLARKRMLQIFEKLGIQFLELDRDGAKNAIEKIGEAKGVNVTASQVFKGLALAFLLPSGLLIAAMKKVHYTCRIREKPSRLEVKGISENYWNCLSF